MTGTMDENLAWAERMLENDSDVAAKVLDQRARELEAYHTRVLALARPVIAQLLVLYAAELAADEDGRTEPPETRLLSAISMALDDPRLGVTFKRNVAKTLATVATEAARQKRVRRDDEPKQELTTERPS